MADHGVFDEYRSGTGACHPDCVLGDHNWRKTEEGIRVEGVGCIIDVYWSHSMLCDVYRLILV